MANFCQNCGNKLKATDKFCVKCGTPIVRAEQDTTNPINKENIQETAQNLKETAGNIYDTVKEKAKQTAEKSQEYLQSEQFQDVKDSVIEKSKQATEKSRAILENKIPAKYRNKKIYIAAAAVVLIAIIAVVGIHKKLSQSLDNDYPETAYSENGGNTSDNAAESEQQASEPRVINTSTGTDNPYTEPHKKGTGRQFTMTIEEFVEKYNEKINKRHADILYETEEDLNEFFNDGKEHGWFSSPLDLGEATVDSSAAMEGEKATSYIFSGASKLNGSTGDIRIYCYKDTGKICDVYCVVPKEWSLKGNARQIPRTQTPKTREDYVSIPSDFQSFAGDVFSVINPEADGYDFFSEIFKEVGAENRNYKDGVYYAFRTTDESIKLQMAAVDWSFFENK